MEPGNELAAYNEVGYVGVSKQDRCEETSAAQLNRPNQTCLQQLLLFHRLPDHEESRAL